MVDDAMVGRPTLYREEYVEQARKLTMLGASDAEVADFFNVNVATVHRWKHAHPEFCDALKIGKEQADARVERSLYHRAIGYEQEAVKIFMPAGAAEPVYAPYIERIGPDTTAAIFWLKNRKPAEWRDQRAVELTGKDGGPIQTIDTSRLSTAALEELVKVADAAREADTSGPSGG